MVLVHAALFAQILQIRDQVVDLDGHDIRKLNVFPVLNVRPVDVQGAVVAAVMAHKILLVGFHQQRQHGFGADPAGKVSVAERDAVLGGDIHVFRPLRSGGGHLQGIDQIGKAQFVFQARLLNGCGKHIVAEQLVDIEARPVRIQPFISLIVAQDQVGGDRFHICLRGVPCKENGGYAGQKQDPQLVLPDHVHDLGNVLHQTFVFCFSFHVECHGNSFSRRLNSRTAVRIQTDPGKDCCWNRAR